MAGIYIHIPFCIKKCAYCDFASFRVRDRDGSLVSSYLSALKKEIAVFAVNNPAFQVSSIFFGGGTPSLLTPSQISEIMDLLLNSFKVSEDCETSMEVNPESLIPGMAADYAKAGINRVSMGVQSFNDENLRLLGRVHNSEKAFQAFQELSGGGFGSIGIDLIFGIPGQSIEDWKQELERAVILNTHHISAYCLTPEEGTPLGDNILEEKIEMPEDEVLVEMMDYASDFLPSKGYDRYEISNYAKPGHRCRHNDNYWNYGEYRGFGSAASSFIKDWRFTNVEDPGEYINRTEKGLETFDRAERLSLERRMGEYAMLRLRTTEGILTKDFKNRFNVDFMEKFQSETENLIRDGSLITKTVEGGERIYIPLKKLALQNEIAAAFITICDD